MARRMIPVLFVLACASTSWAQGDDALLPTHLIDGGQVFATGTLRYLGGQGDAEILGVSGDFKQSFFTLQLDAGIGLGMGFEIDASINYQFIGRTQADFSSTAAEFETEDVGFSDLVLNPRYALLKEDAASPQVIVGAILVAPVGNDKDGQTGVTSGGTKTQDQEDGGVGLGVWRYGFEAGISKRLTVLEPYLLTNYVFADRRKDEGVQENRADVWNLTAGAFWHLSPQATLDTRLSVARQGVDKQETSGTETEEESHFTYTAQAALQLKVSSSATFLILAGATLVQDHQVNDVINLEMRDDLVWFAGAGLHLLFGGGDPEN